MFLDYFILRERNIKLLYNKSKFLSNVDKLGKTLGKTYDRPSLQIKCSHKDSHCECKTRRKKHHKRYNPIFKKKSNFLKKTKPRCRFLGEKKLQENMINVSYVTRRDTSLRIVLKGRVRRWSTRFLRWLVSNPILSNLCFQKLIQNTLILTS